jgi:hypothetical protein
MARKDSTTTDEPKVDTQAAPAVEPKTVTTDEGTFTTDAQGVVVHTRP